MDPINIPSGFKDPLMFRSTCGRLLVQFNDKFEMTPSNVPSSSWTYSSSSAEILVTCNPRVSCWSPSANNCLQASTNHKFSIFARTIDADSNFRLANCFKKLDEWDPKSIKLRKSRAISGFCIFFHVTKRLDATNVYQVGIRASMATRMIRLARRCSSTNTGSITGILKDLKLIEKSADLKISEVSEVEVAYKDLKATKGPAAFDRQLANQLKLYSNSGNYKSFYHLLKKVEYLDGQTPSVDVYNQVFRSIFLRCGSQSSNAMASFALQLVQECVSNRIELNDQSFHYLDKIISSSDLLQLQLQYQQLLKRYDFFNISYLISSGQYERSLELFHEVWPKTKTDKSLQDLRIFALLRSSLSRDDYPQVLEFLKIITEESTLPLESHYWSMITTDAATESNYDLSLYCYKFYLEKMGLEQLTTSLLLKISDVFATHGDTENVLILLKFLKEHRKVVLDSSKVARIVESYCLKDSYVSAWKTMGVFESANLPLQPQDFTFFCKYYPVLRTNKDIAGIVGALQELELPAAVTKIVYRTIFRQVHNNTNLTGICRLISCLIDGNEKDPIFDNYDIITHSISRSNSAKWFTFKFHDMMLAKGIRFDSKDYFYLMQNSLFGGGADNYNLLKFLIIEQLSQYGDLTPSQLNLLERCRRNKSINAFLQQYLTDKLQQKTPSSPPDYSSLLQFDKRNLVPIADLAKAYGYNHDYDVKNTECLDHLQAVV